MANAAVNTPPAAVWVLVTSDSDTLAVTLHRTERDAQNCFLENFGDDDSVIWSITEEVLP